MPVESVADAPTGMRTAWSPATRLAFRVGFSVAVLSLFHLVSFITEYFYFEKLRASVNQWLDPFGNLEFRVTRYIGASAIRLVTGSTGTPEQIARQYRYALCYLVAVSIVAVASTLVWSVVDRRRGDYVALNDWLRPYARYALALVMMTYATVKVVPTQFGSLTPGELLKPVGQLNRFWVLWNFMVVSTGYTIFTGAVELLGCILMFFRRTTLLGALLLGAAVTNVFAMDIAYNVFGAAMVAGLLIVLAAVVVTPYMPALVNVLLLGRADRMPDEPTSVISRWRYAPLAKALVLVLLVSVRVSNGLEQRRTYFGRGHGVYGMFDVDRFVCGGVVVTPLASDAKTWKRVATDGRYNSSAVSVQFANGDVKQFRLTEDTAKQQWTLHEASKNVATLHYGVSADGTVDLEGQIADDLVQIHLRPVDVQSLPLLRAQ